MGTYGEGTAKASETAANGGGVTRSCLLPEGHFGRCFPEWLKA
jgi:hypothetical protein